jgi:hypothetical protein
VGVHGCFFRERLSRLPKLLRLEKLAGFAKWKRQMWFDWEPNDHAVSEEGSFEEWKWRWVGWRSGLGKEKRWKRQRDMNVALEMVVERLQGKLQCFAMKVAKMTTYRNSSSGRPPLQHLIVVA